MNRSRDIIVLGGSSGGLAAIGAVLSALPKDFQAAVLIVLHRMPEPPFPEGLTHVLAARSSLPTLSPRDEQPLEPGHVYVGPADHQMLLQNNLIRLECSPKENRFRPCVCDVGLRSI